MAADDYRHLTNERQSVEAQLIESAQRLEILNRRQKESESREAVFDADLKKMNFYVEGVEGTEGDRHKV